MKIKLNCKYCGKEFEQYESIVKKGGGKFCSISCGTTFRNLTNNPSKNPEVRMKISKNHADISGVKNPMYGRKGALAPSYIDGRSKFKGETYKKILIASGKEHKCIVCGSEDKLQVHHIDCNHKNNEIDNLTWLCSNCHQNIIHKRKRNEKGQFVKKECLNDDIDKSRAFCCRS